MATSLSDPPPAAASARRSYGNSLRELRLPLKAALLTGIILGLFGTLSMASEGTLTLLRGGLMVLVALGVPAAMLALVSPTFASRIVVRDGRVLHTLFRSKVLSNLPLEDYLRVRRQEHGCAAVIHFTGKAEIRIFAMSVAEIERMSRDLDALRRNLELHTDLPAPPLEEP